MFRIAAGLIIFVALIGGLLLQAGSAQAEETSIQPIRNSETRPERLLGATVQISMQAQVDGQPQIGNGLGSLVHVQGEIVIVTHNHWGAVLQNTSLIELRDARSNLLMRTMGLEFSALIRYQDKGTLVLAAPPALLEKMDPAAALPAGPAAQVPQGAIVQIVYRQPGQRDRVALQQAVVEEICNCSGLPGLQLRSLDGQPLQKGDSGGGVYLQGRLVANNWISVTADTAEEIAQAGALLQVGEYTYTDISYAASLPAEMQ